MHQQIYLNNLLNKNEKYKYEGNILLSIPKLKIKKEIRGGMETNIIHILFYFCILVVNFVLFFYVLANK